jgi:mannose-6-phosphate isomerase-like protein (cupin superfamily)
MTSRAIDLREAMQGEPHWADEDDGGKAAFWMPARFGSGALWVGRWQGRSPWELHPDCDELLHVLEGEVEVTLLADAGPTREILRAGSVMVIPRGVWHRQETRGEVVQYGVTPGPTDHSTAEDPRA